MTPTIPMPPMAAIIVPPFAHATLPQAAGLKRPFHSLRPRVRLEPVRGDVPRIRGFRLVP